MRKSNDTNVVEKVDALRGRGARVIPVRAFLNLTFDLCEYGLTLADLILMGCKCLSTQRHLTVSLEALQGQGDPLT